MSQLTEEMLVERKYVKSTSCWSCLCCAGPHIPVEVELHQSDVTIVSHPYSVREKISFLDEAFEMIFNDADPESPTGCSITFANSKIKLFPQDTAQASKWRDVMNKNANADLSNLSTAAVYRYGPMTRAAVGKVLDGLENPLMKRGATKAVAVAGAYVAGGIVAGVAAPLVLAVAAHEANRLVKEPL